MLEILKTNIEAYHIRLRYLNYKNDGKGRIGHFSFMRFFA